MASKLLVNMLKNRASGLLLHTGQLTPRSRAILQSTDHVRYFRRKLACTPSVSATIVAELRKANVRCTSSGVKAFDKAYASLAFANPYYLRYNLPKDDAENPVYIYYKDLNTRGAPVWRNYEAYELWIDHQVSKLWEALYEHSDMFRKMIDGEEDYRESDRCSIIDSSLWGWMAIMIRDGYVERGDIDDLPVAMLRDIVIGSGQAKESSRRRLQPRNETPKAKD
ncbi:hypothetical protein Dda_1947 [Drechslerella dactyloides]|uniref:Uncharacterized protein n=1 Tax=Drechslerella dactyloides TaxID=74499 RepID=A0AAD6J2L5_DREDA|nr:hypothetical protein Dda_1947 [Drechslerella dactyloides]